MFGSLYNLAGSLIAGGINAWVRATGKRVPRSAHPWLDSPLGTKEVIGGEFYAQLAEERNLRILPEAGLGLLPSFAALRGSGFDPEEVDRRIHDFYERTSAYQLSVWSEAPLYTKFFLWGLTTFVSRRMNQLNFPTSSLELAGGMTNEVLPMVDESGRRVFTGWLRKLNTGERVVYAGLYSVERTAEHPDPCVKVTFPIPRGSASVFLRPEAGPDGSFKLISSGSRFGDPGFYRMVEAGSEHWRVRFVRTLRELFHLYIDGQGVLRTDHRVTFLGMTVIKLHYKIEPKADHAPEQRA